MFILGFQHRKVRKYGPKKSYHCNNCLTIGNWELIEITLWVTLFFIPIIPYKKKYLLVCPKCGNYLSVEKEKYLVYKNNKNVPDLKNATGDEIYYGKTETQINYLEQMREVAQTKEDNKQKQNIEVISN